MKIFGLTVGEIATLMGIFGTILGLIYRLILMPLIKNILNPLESAIKEMTSAIDAIKKESVHEHSEIHEELDEHEDAINKNKDDIVDLKVRVGKLEK